MPTFLVDQPRLDWSGPAQDVLSACADAYPDQGSLEMLALRAGLEKSRLPRKSTAYATWRAVLDAAAAAGRLRALVEAAANDPARAAFASRFRAALQLEHTPRSAPARPAGAPFTGHFEQPALRDLFRAAVRAGFVMPESFRALTEGVHPDFRASLPMSPSKPALLTVFNRLNEVEHLIDGQVPMTVVLSNAVDLSLATEYEAVFAGALAQLG